MEERNVTIVRDPRKSLNSIKFNNFKTLSDVVWRKCMEKKFHNPTLPNNARILIWTWGRWKFS